MASAAPIARYPRLSPVPSAANAAGLRSAASTNAAAGTRSLDTRRIGESSFRTFRFSFYRERLGVVVSDGSGDIDRGEDGEHHRLYERDEHPHHQERHGDQDRDEGEEHRG